MQTVLCSCTKASCCRLMLTLFAILDHWYANLHNINESLWPDCFRLTAIRLLQLHASHYTGIFNKQHPTNTGRGTISRCFFLKRSQFHWSNWAICDSQYKINMTLLVSSRYSYWRVNCLQRTSVFWIITLDITCDMITRIIYSSNVIEQCSMHSNKQKLVSMTTSSAFSFYMAFLILSVVSEFSTCKSVVTDHIGTCKPHESNPAAQ